MWINMLVHSYTYNKINKRGINFFLKCFLCGFWMSNGYRTNIWWLTSEVRKRKNDFWCWNRKYKIFNYGHSTTCGPSLQFTIGSSIYNCGDHAIVFNECPVLSVLCLSNSVIFGQSSLFCVFNVFSVFLGRMRNLLIPRNILKSLASQSVWNHYLNTRYFVEFLKLEVTSAEFRNKLSC